MRMGRSAVTRFVEFDVDAVTLARRLLGQRLVSVRDGERVAGTIVEVEAYVGVHDLASHAKRGHRSPRNESMYGPGGLLYVYFTYGMHHCANVVAGCVDDPVAVLIRGVVPTEGLDVMQRRRGPRVRERDLASGPGRLTQAFALDREDDGRDLRVDRGVMIERARSRALPARRIDCTPRIGVDYAGVWAEEPLRFVARA